MKSIILWGTKLWLITLVIPILFTFCAIIGMILCWTNTFPQIIDFWKLYYYSGYIDDIPVYRIHFILWIFCILFTWREFNK